MDARGATSIASGTAPATLVVAGLASLGAGAVHAAAVGLEAAHGGGVAAGTAAALGAVAALGTVVYLVAPGALRLPMPAVAAPAAPATGVLVVAAIVAAGGETHARRRP
jgi:hypothetical protein